MKIYLAGSCSKDKRSRMESIAAEHVYLLVNLDEAIAGENLYKAQVMFDTAYMDCGAIGSYSVLITLTEITQGES